MDQTAPKQFFTEIAKLFEGDTKEVAEQELARMVSSDQYIGDLITLDYGHADILVHDTQRNRANGIPHGCLLLATRVTPADLTEGRLPSDPELLLIRVSESARLRSDADLETVRLDAVKRANDTDRTYDESGHTDQFTLNMLRYSGIRCRVLGTFRACQSGSDDKWEIHFGSDIANFNAGQGMKIYKPSGASLEYIVNSRRIEGRSSSARRIGRLRYAAAIIEADTPEAVPVLIQASDFVAQRTALFGMTRTGKSNTTKTIAKALFELRSEKEAEKVGQLVFDPNGEYANDNPQDQGCLRNLQYEKPEYEGHVQTYGSYEHPHDPERNITKFNFYGTPEPANSPPSQRDLKRLLHSLYQGKQIIDDALAEETAGYVTDFRNARLDDDRGAVGEKDYGEYTRFRRRIFVYRCILAQAGFRSPARLPNTSGLFSKDIRKLMSESPEKIAQYVDLLDGNGSEMPWDVAGNFGEAFAKWTSTEEFKNFDADYARNHHGRNWSDSHLKGLLGIYSGTRGLAIARKARAWHNLDSEEDYADAVVNHVRNGKLVIVDQLLGDPELNRQAAERIVLNLFNAQQQSFIEAKMDPKTGEIVRPPHVIIYAEEAHTLLPRSSEDDNTNIWARIAKEGAKFNIGMVYSTQEPSSIQANILKNTENWFIAHLNNTDETNQISKFNDFKDFAGGILNVSETGLVKMRTKSSYFTIPVQIDEFTAPPRTATGLFGSANSQTSR